MSEAKSPILRFDLNAAPRWRRGHRWWVVHDPVRNSYHRLTDPDLRNLSQGTASRELAAHAASAGLLGQVQNNIVPPAQSWSWMMFRIAAIPMDAAAAKLNRVAGLLFSPLAILFWLGCMGIAIATVLTGWQRLTGQLPNFHQFVASENAVLLVLVVVCSKTLHELGHAVACKRLGGRVGEIGVLLLCGMPCMYCDVTDSWRLASRWQRAGVMLAGMYIECVLATVATFVWWITTAPSLSLLCLDIMFVCSVSTLLFNGNPLGRYDGYFILCDLFDSPNLHASAATAWHEVALMTLGQGVARLQDFVLAAYHLLSNVYRTFITVVIGLGGARWMWSLYLKPIAVLVIVTTVAMAIVPWLRAWRAWFRREAPWTHVPKLHRGLISGVVFCLLLGWLGHERPVRVTGTGSVEVLNSSSVFALPGGGRVTQVLHAVGQSVQEGDALATLDSPELESQALQLQARRDLLAARLTGLERRAILEPSLLEQRQTLRESIHAAERQLELTHDQLRQLVLRAPRSGTILPPDKRSFDPAAELTGFVLPGDALWCRIGNLQQSAVKMQVDRDFRRHIGTGDLVRVTSASHKGQVLEIEVTTIVEANESVRDELTQSTANQKITVWGTLPADTGWPPGTEVWGWIEGVQEPVWKSWCHTLYRMIAP